MISLDAPSSSNTCITVITRARSYFQKHKKIPVKIPVSISAIQSESIPYGNYLRVWIGVAELRMIYKKKNRIKNNGVIKHKDKCQEYRHHVFTE